MDDIAPKYNPLTLKHHDETLSLTPNCKAKNREARQTEDGEVTFDPSITCKDGIAECFRVFMDPMRLSMNPAIQHQQRGRNLTYLEMKVYTDGSCKNNGKLNTESGSGVWIEANHLLNRVLKNEGPKQSNQVGELVAVIAAVGTLPNYCKLMIITDSRYVIEGLTEHLQKWEDNGWIEIENAPLFKRAAYLLKKRSAPMAFKWVKGHRGVQGNEESDKLAKEGAGKEIGDAISTHIPIEFDLQGAKLATLTQAVAYKGIRERKTVQPHQTTAENLDPTRNAIMTYTGESETNETIWKSIRKHNLRIRVQQFLYKAMHGTQMVRAVWMKIPGLKQRGTCTTCNTSESMSHILIHCVALPATNVWNLAKELWLHDSAPWPQLSLGAILGCGCLSAQIRENEDEQNELRNEDRKWTSTKHRGATRLLQILIFETAHLIWVLCCERVIQNKTHTMEEIRLRWHKAINRRLTDDKINATMVTWKLPFTQLVKATWEPVLKKSSDPPIEWIKDREVLVGRSTQQA